MYRVGQVLKFLGLSLLAGLLFLLRYILNTPQPLESALPGEDHIYKWTRGHIFYKTLGALDAPPLLLLHAPEIGASAYEMRSIMADLAQHYRVYAPDLIGFGLSDRPDIDYSADIYVALYQDFLTNVIGKPAILLASGLSCNYAVALASIAPELCQRLVLLSPASLFKQTEAQPWLDRLTRVTLVGTFIYSLLTPRFILRRVVLWQHDERHFSDDDFNYYFASAHQLGAQYAALAFISGKLQPDVSMPFEHLQLPILLIEGDDSSQHVQSVIKQYTLPPQMQTVFLHGAGSQMHEGNPQQVIASILQWQEAENNAVVHVPLDSAHETSPSSDSISTEDELEDTQEVREAVQDSQPPSVVNSEPAIETPVVSGDVVDTETVEAYCVKCRKKRIMQDARRIVTKNGRSAMEGTCPVCATKLFRFVSG